ncbi:MAG: sulfatase/phosphatase domain-containing protein, partial [Opitutales bacterium]
VKWPGKVKAGSQSDLVTGLEDWMVTILDLIEAKDLLPAGRDGISIAPTLLGQKQTKRLFLYREFSGYGGQQAVWLGKWKGIRQKMLRKGKNNDPLKIQLYDLEADPSESTDLASKHPVVVERMAKLMAEQHVPSPHFPMKPID